MKRDAAQTIFRTVVFAGAMLGTGACGKKPAPAAPANTAPAADPAATTPETDNATPTPDPCAGASADPCGGGERPRTDPCAGGGMGRGFVLS